MARDDLTCNQMYSSVWNAFGHFLSPILGHYFVCIALPHHHRTMDLLEGKAPWLDPCAILLNHALGMEHGGRGKAGKARQSWRRIASESIGIIEHNIMFQVFGVLCQLAN